MHAYARFAVNRRVAATHKQRMIDHKLQSWGGRAMPDEKRTADEIIKLIRRLRWIGLQEESEKVRLRLAHHGRPPADRVSTPQDPD